MKRTLTYLIVGASLASVLAERIQAQTLVYGLGAGNTLVSFIAPEAPTGVIATSAPLPIMELGAGQSVVGIDFRPLDGLLYAVARNAANEGFIYTVNTVTGVATNIPLTNALPVTGVVAIDFNPIAVSGANALRVETSTDLNNRVTGFATTGTPTSLTNNVDGTLNFGTPAGDPDVVATAYSNNAGGLPGAGGTGGTTQYVIDATTNALYIQSTPNSGTLGNGTTPGTPVGPLVSVDPANGTAAGLDIVTGTNRALASLSTDGTNYGLYEINLGTGAATLLGTFDGLGGTVVRDIAAPIPEPGSMALVIAGAGLLGLARRRKTS